MNLAELDIAAFQKNLKQGQINSTELCRYYLERINQMDRQGPSLGAIIEINPEAESIAADLDREYRRQGPRGPLHGVPIVIKDSFDTSDGMMTTAGSLALDGNIADEDAFVVRRLRKAGAVLLGKTNMSEWGYFRSTRQCSGWSSRGGQTRNPYVLSRSPSGSSSGSAVAVSADFCVAALGAEVDGSVVRPACNASIVGLKPTVGLLSRSGIIGVADPQDTAGPMARNVRDVAILLNTLAATDPDDPATRDSDANRPDDYLQFLDPDGLREVRLGVARSYFGFHEGVDGVIEKTLRKLSSLGAVLVDPVPLPPVPLFFEPELELFLYDFKRKLNHYLKSHPRAPVRNLKELIEFNRKHADRIMPYFGQELLEKSQAKGEIDEKAYQEAKAACRRISRTEGIDPILKEYQLDAIVAPTDGTPAWLIDPLLGDKILGGCAPLPAMAGYPHLTVPAGYVEGLPVGLSFIAGPFREGQLLRFGYALEQATHIRKAPAFVPATP